MSSGNSRDEQIAASSWESHWLIERASEIPGRPLYWSAYDGTHLHLNTRSGMSGIGAWTHNPWEATRYETREDAERAIRQWAVHPVVPEAVAVEHGFEVSRGE